MWLYKLVPDEVPEVILGGVNDDGAVTIGDVTTLIDYLLGSNPEPFNWDNADVSQDDNVSLYDVTTLLDLLLSNQPAN